MEFNNLSPGVSKLLPCGRMLLLTPLLAVGFITQEAIQKVTPKDKANTPVPSMDFWNILFLKGFDMFFILLSYNYNQLLNWGNPLFGHKYRFLLKNHWYFYL